jgi:transcriptional regulator with XRE-family HTH domain
MDGKSLQQLREDSGYSTRDLARGTGIPRSTYERRELNPGALTLSELRAIAEFYGIPFREFAAALESAA